MNEEDSSKDSEKDEKLSSRSSTVSLDSLTSTSIPSSMCYTTTSEFFYKNDLKQRVEATAKKISHKFSKIEYCKSTTDQLYAVLILQGNIWNTVYLFIQDPWHNFGPNYRAALRRTALRSSHLSNTGTDAFVQRVHEMFNNPTLEKVREVFPKVARDYDRKFTYRKLNKLWARNYDNYLEVGDIVLTKWWVQGIFHAGIYIGNGKVIHRSGGGSRDKSQSYPKEGSLVYDFAGGEKATLWVMKFIVRIRTSEQIATEAKEYAQKAIDDKSVIGEYQLMFNDCQKFVTKCATGDFNKWDWPFKLNNRH